MAHKPPIKIKQLLKTGILNPDRFFQLLSEENNYIDKKTAREFYYGLVRLLTSELKNNGVVRLPDIGDIALVKSRDRSALVGKFRTIVKGSYMLKFYPNRAWRDYFKQLENRSGLEGALDPREKTLGMDLSSFDGYSDK